MTPNLFCSAQFFFPFHDIEVSKCLIFEFLAILGFLFFPMFSILGMQPVIETNKGGEFLCIRTYAVK